MDTADEIGNDSPDRSQPMKRDASSDRDAPKMSGVLYEEMPGLQMKDPLWRGKLTKRLVN